MPQEFAWANAVLVLQTDLFRPNGLHERGKKKFIFIVLAVAESQKSRSKNPLSCWELRSNSESVWHLLPALSADRQAAAVQFKYWFNNKYRRSKSYRRLYATALSDYPAKDA